MNLRDLNPFGSFFKKLDKVERLEDDNEKYIAKAIGRGDDDKPVVGDIDLATYEAISPHFDATQVSFQQFFSDKKSRTGKYREMAIYPEISNAIDMICDEAVSIGSTGAMFNFEVTKKSDIKKSDIRALNAEFEYVVNDIMNFRNMGWELFYKWLVDGELYLEVVMNDKKDKIMGVKPLSSINMVPVFQNGIIHKYIQALDDKVVEFEASRIIYISYGKYGKNKQDIRGYLEGAVKVYNQLRNLEDSLIIYRLVRAPERRVWNIEVGQMPTGKAEEFLKQVQRRYKKQINYDSESGMINSSQNIQALTEDFWFARRNGAGTTVETTQGGVQLGELEDVNYFMRKLYKSLKIPPTRWGDQLGGGQTSYSNGQDIEREELNFSKFVERLQNRFKILIYQLFIKHLRIKGYDIKFLSADRYSIDMNLNNYYKHYRENDLLESMLSMYTSYSDLVISPDNPNAPFAKEFFMKEIVKFPEQLIIKNEIMLKREKADLQTEMDNQADTEQDYGEDDNGDNLDDGDVGGPDEQDGSSSDDLNPKNFGL